MKSLDGKPDPGAADHWDAEIMRRLEQIDEGAVQPVDRAELARQMRQQFVSG